MIQQPFIQPRFVGSRFDETTIPLVVAKDLAAYEELLLALASHLFKQNQSERFRVPKGFVSDVSLHLVKIDPGSAMPAIVAALTGATMLTGLPTEVEASKELINRVIATEPGQQFPPEFPKHLYKFFNRLGGSLRGGESIEWNPSSPLNKSVLTVEKRDRLRNAASERHYDNVQVTGKIEALDTAKKRGTIRIEGAGTLQFHYEDPSFDDIKYTLGNKYTHASITGIGTFDVNNQLKAIKMIESFDKLAHYPLTTSIRALSSLEIGWLNGNGAVPSDASLNLICEAIQKSFPEGLEYPSVVPTAEGNVILEWIRPRARVELEINLEERNIEVYATNVDIDQFVEVRFNLEQWDEAFLKIYTLV